MRALNSGTNPKVIVPLASFKEWPIIHAEIKKEITLIQNNGYQQSKEKLLSETCPFGSSYIKAGVDFLEMIEAKYAQRGFLEDDNTPTHFFASVVEQDKFILLPNRESEPTTGAMSRVDVKKIYEFLSCRRHEYQDLKNDVPPAYFYRFLWCCDSICHKNIGWITRFSSDPRKTSELKKRGGDLHQHYFRLWNKMRPLLSSKLITLDNISDNELDLIGMGAVELFSKDRDIPLKSLKPAQVDLNTLWDCFLKQLPNLGPCRYLSSHNYMSAPYCMEVPIKISSPARDNIKFMTIEELYAATAHKNKKNRAKKRPKRPTCPNGL